MNTEFARQQMVEQQVRTWDVDDVRVLTTLAALSRDRFVPSMYADLAYADTEIPLSSGQHMLRPALEGRILQSLQLKQDDEVLEIGTGSGYLSACLAALARSVTSIEIFDGLLATAEKNLAQAGIGNVTLHCMDMFEQLPDGDFDVIVVGGSTPQIAERLPGVLRPGGRMFTVIGDAPNKNAVLITRGAADDPEGDMRDEYLFETDMAELINAPQIEPFHF